jgi:hypothetical protein
MLKQFKILNGFLYLPHPLAVHSFEYPLDIHLSGSFNHTKKNKADPTNF